MRAACAVRAIGFPSLPVSLCENIARANESKAHLCTWREQKKNALDIYAHPAALHVFDVPEIELHELLAIIEIELRNKSQADCPVAQPVAVSHIEADGVK